MMRKTLTGLAVVAGCLTMAASIPAVQAQMLPPAQVITNGPQGSPPADWSARQNVIQSERYERLVDTNRAFRHARMIKECGPITDPQLHQQCVASFSQNEAAKSVSTTSPGDYDSGS